MIKKTAHIAFSVWLSLLLLFGSTPKEFIHNFANHADTIDSRISKGLVIDKVHHHCSFLSFNLMPFAEGFQQPLLRLIKQSFQIQHATAVAVFVPYSTATLSLRGPPAC